LILKKHIRIFVYSYKNFNEYGPNVTSTAKVKAVVLTEKEVASLTANIMSYRKIAKSDY